jgi:ABC-type bacteriocin/lantibiotic exporter with double-glycine peptidase domain
MRLTWRSFQFLTARQKIELSTYLMFKVGTAAFDILGLVLLSTSMSLLASTSVDHSAMVKSILDWCRNLGFGNTYAVFALLATGFFLLKSIIAIWLNNRIAIFGARVEAEQASKLFANFSNTEIGAASAETQSSYQFAVGRSAHVLFAQVPVVLGTIVGEIALALAIGIYLSTLNVFLLCFSLLFLGLVGYLNFSIVSKGVVKNNQRAIDSGFITQQLVLDVLANSRQIRAQRKSVNFVRRFAESRMRQAVATSKVVALGYVSRYITEIALIVGVALFLAQRAFFGASDIAAPTLTVFLAAAFRVIASMIPIQTAFATLSIIDHEGKLAFSLLDGVNASQSENTIPDEKQPRIAFENVSYRYSRLGEKMFRGLSLEIPFGSFVVVKGPSGAGKSTLVDLMVGLKHPSEGHIRVFDAKGGEEIDWRNIALGYVPQKPNLIEGTLLENIALSYDEASDSRSKASRAMQKAQLSEWASLLEDGLDTKFSVNLNNLSGGQLQRLGIARALYDEPAILVLDEGTNSLDAETELEICGILQSFKATMTIIVISHNDVFDSMATLRIHVDKFANSTIEGMP